MGLCPGSQVWARACNLVPIPGPEQPHSSPEDTRGVDGSLRAAGIAPVALFAQIMYGATALLGRPHDGFERTARGGMTKKLLVSVVEDDRFFRESMGRLMRSLGYTVEAFPSAADFLASRHLSETACLS